MQKTDLDKRLQSSFKKELVFIQEDLYKEQVVECQIKGLNQFHLRNRDCADFVHSNPDDRLIFASQSGLFPENS